MSAIQQALLAGGVTLLGYTPAVWDATGSGGNNQTITGAGLIATYNNTGSSNRGCARTTSTRNSGKRQVDFRITGANTVFIGVARVTATLVQYPGFDSDGFALYVGDGKTYIANSGTVLAGGALTFSTWYSLVYDFGTGAFSVYNNAGTLLGTVTVGTFIGALYLMAGSATGAGGQSCEINPSPATLYGGAVAWDSV